MGVYVRITDLFIVTANRGNPSMHPSIHPGSVSSCFVPRVIASSCLSQALTTGHASRYTLGHVSLNRKFSIYEKKSYMAAAPHRKLWKPGIRIVLKRLVGRGSSSSWPEGSHVMCLLLQRPNEPCLRSVSQLLPCCCCCPRN